MRKTSVMGMSLIELLLAMLFSSWFFVTVLETFGHIRGHQKKSEKVLDEKESREQASLLLRAMQVINLQTGCDSSPVNFLKSEKGALSFQVPIGPWGFIQNRFDAHWVQVKSESLLKKGSSLILTNCEKRSVNVIQAVIQDGGLQNLNLLESVPKWVQAGDSVFPAQNVRVLLEKETLWFQKEGESKQSMIQGIQNASLESLLNEEGRA